MVIPRKKISISGLREAFRLYSYIRPYRATYILGLFFLFGSSVLNLAFPKLLGDLVNAGNEGNLAVKLNRIALMLAGLLVLFRKVYQEVFQEGAAGSGRVQHGCGGDPAGHTECEGLYQ